ncbi:MITOCHONDRIAL RIBOSOME-ASSOCIATED GTPASE 1 [Salix koriyanagi]|uniref:MITOCHONDRIAL RIBOSOME-ASSOCIATED GTPASE 1 n=1 Tax=Salix koriyanagi TaxID=2511006 RepID=A0A9Q0P4E6_9ROSI|nr:MITOCHONDRIAL RIBOSOME-ASSOCIATED GTPASE 1 [Salix koriyanagi]
MGVEVLGLWLPNPAVQFNRPPFLHLSPPARAALVTSASLSSPPPTIQIVGGRSTPSWQGSGNDVYGGETDWIDFETDLYHWTKPLRPVQWYPGHIAKTERELKEQIKLMDVVIEVRDARIPLSTTHPQMDVWLGNRKRILVLNREDMISKGRPECLGFLFCKAGNKSCLFQWPTWNGYYEAEQVCKVISGKCKCQTQRQRTPFSSRSSWNSRVPKCWEVIFDQPFAEAPNVSQQLPDLELRES